MAIPDNNRGVMITADAARRIGRAVQAFEHGRRPAIKAKPLRTAADDGTEPVRIARVPSQWAKDTELEVDLIYESDCDDEDGGSAGGSGGSGGGTLMAWNRLFDIPAEALVYLGMALNGCWQVLAVSADCSTGSDGSGSGSGCDCATLGGQDLTTITGYDETTTQLLGHEYGCLRWFDTTDCGSGSS